MIKKGEINIFKILLGLSVIIFVAISFVSFRQNSVLEKDQEGVVLMETLSSGVQRVSKLELENSSDATLVAELDAVVSSFYDDENNIKYFVENKNVLESVNVALLSWHDFKSSISNFKESGNRTALFSASEENYNVSENALREINRHINESVTKTNKIENAVMINVGIFALLLVKILLDTVDELKKNKELSKSMFIDTSTGLYNRAKCQEVMKSPISQDNIKERAIIMFDLNDLKKTNDLLGHRAGDDLIASFSAQLREATKIFNKDIFVGRYGGDEFIAYFESTEIKEVEVYIKEVNTLMHNFNEHSNKQFKLSCAVGYAITNKETKSMKMRELFDLADNNMYENKIAMKEKKKQEMLSQGIIVEEHKDDRIV